MRKEKHLQTGNGWGVVAVCGGEDGPSSSSMSTSVAEDFDGQKSDKY
jgi:hypothetical protein